MALVNKNWMYYIVEQSGDFIYASPHIKVSWDSFVSYGANNPKPVLIHWAEIYTFPRGTEWIGWLSLRWYTLYELAGKLYIFRDGSHKQITSNKRVTQEEYDRNPELHKLGIWWRSKVQDYTKGYDRFVFLERMNRHIENSWHKVSSDARDSGYVIMSVNRWPYKEVARWYDFEIRSWCIRNRSIWENWIWTRATPVIVWKKDKWIKIYNFKGNNWEFLIKDPGYLARVLEKYRELVIELWKYLVEDFWSDWSWKLLLYWKEVSIKRWKSAFGELHGIYDIYSIG
jgi:hypothetical protein